MGRYLMGLNDDYKFWFAVQPTGDILDFGVQSDNIQATVYYSDLEDIKTKVNDKKDLFEKEFKITFDEFMKKIENKGYLRSSNDKETNTVKWGEMCRMASWIDLGNHIIKSLEENKDDLYLEGEN